MSKSSPSKSTANDDTQEITRLVTKWRRWRSDLKQYWPEIQKMQEMYEFFKREGSETASDVGLNTAFAIVESMVSKLNDTHMKVSVKAHGQNNMDLFERYIGNILKSAIYDKGVEQIAGPFRKIKQIIERDFLVKGNFVAEVGYCYETTLKADGSKKVVADNPMVTPLPLFSVTFDSAKTLMTSGEYFVEKYVTMEYLEDRAQVDSTWMNLGDLKESMRDKDDQRTRSAEDQNFISGDYTVMRHAASIRLLEHWKGAKLTVIANDRIMIRSVYDPMKIGSHPLITGMNYVVEGRPYGYGEINAIYKPVRAQDTILNQRIETINQYLRGTVFVDPDSNIDLDMVAMMLESGGVGYGKGTDVVPLQKPLPPSVAYTETGELQTAIERTARFSPYAAGTPSSGVDHTQGTKGGIIALQDAAEPNFQVKIDDITDMFLTPLAYKYLPMMANMMSATDIRYGEILGEDEPWIGATKNILLGHPTLKDLHAVGMITDAGFAAATTTAVTDPTTGQPAVDPQTGQPQTTPIPGASTAHMAEVDWIIEVNLDVHSSHDRQARLQTAQSMIQWLQSIGVHFSPARTASFFETKMDELKGLDEIVLTQQEMQAMSSQGPREQLRVNVNFNDLPPEGQVQAAAQAGITLNPADINAHAANKALMAHGSALDQTFADHAGKATSKAIEMANTPPPPTPAAQ